MPSPEQVREEALFWLGSQEREHLYLMALGLHDASLREAARKLHASFEEAAEAGDAPALIALSAGSQALKRAAAEAARTKWVGFLHASLLEHMVKEIDHALLRMRRDVEPRHIIAFWAEERSTAAGEMSRLLDLSETARAAKAVTYQSALRNLNTAAGKPSSMRYGNIARDVLQATIPVNMFLRDMPSFLSIAHPLLVEHELREGMVAEAMLIDIAATSERIAS